MMMRRIARKTTMMCLPVGLIVLSVLPNAGQSGGGWSTACADSPSMPVIVAGTAGDDTRQAGDADGGQPVVMSAGTPTGDGTGGTAGSAEVVVSLHSVRAIRNPHAHDLGALSEWQPGYYVAHWWSPSGQSILGMEAGDTVMLDGRAVHIDGVTRYPKKEILEHVREDLGYDCIIFQTCYPDEYNRLVYGHADGMGGFTIVRE